MPSRSHDAYSLLGVPMSATTEEIDAAFEHKIIEHENDDPFVIYSLQLAHEMLHDPFLRAVYDNRAGSEEPRKRSPRTYYVQGRDDRPVKRGGRWPNGSKKCKRVISVNSMGLTPRQREEAKLERLSMMLDRILTAR